MLVNVSPFVHFLKRTRCNSSNHQILRENGLVLPVSSSAHWLDGHYHHHMRHELLYRAFYLCFQLLSK